MRVMTSLDRTQYPFNFEWGQKEQLKGSFLATLAMNQIDTSFNYVYFLDVLSSLVVDDDKRNSVAKMIESLHIQNFGDKVVFFSTSLTSPSFRVVYFNVFGFVSKGEGDDWRQDSFSGGVRQTLFGRCASAADVRVHLPPQNTVYDHESRFATASREKNQLLHHGERSLSLP